MMSRLVQMFTVAFVLLSASAVHACPVCARDEPGSMGWISIVAFVLSPWLIVATIGLWIRSQTRKETMQLPATEIE
jgi:hypothetical protein